MTKLHMKLLFSIGRVDMNEFGCMSAVLRSLFSLFGCSICSMIPGVAVDLSRRAVDKEKILNRSESYFKSWKERVLSALDNLDAYRDSLKAVMYIDGEQFQLGRFPIARTKIMEDFLSSCLFDDLLKEAGKDLYVLYEKSLMLQIKEAVGCDVKLLKSELLKDFKRARSVHLTDDLHKVRNFLVNLGILNYFAGSFGLLATRDFIPQAVRSRANKTTKKMIKKGKTTKK